MKVQNVMTSETLKYCSPNTNLHEAAMKMREENCGALPVVDSEKKVIGIVTDRDLCLALTKNISTPVQELTVDEVMTKKVHSIYEKDDISYAFERMRKNKVQRLPVKDEHDTLKGIISLDDLVIHSLENGGKEVGMFYEPGENLLKTLDAISSRHEAKLPTIM